MTQAINKNIINCSIIITVYNEEKTICKLLESILNQSHLPEEIIILDGGSTDKTQYIIKEYNLQYSFIKIIIDYSCNKRYAISPIAKGRNIAINAAKNHILAITDAGCQLENNWLYEITKPLINNEADYVGGLYKIFPRTEIEKCYAVLYNMDHITEKTYIPSSRSLAFKKIVWEKVGGYPEDYFYGEDTEFILKLRSIKASFTIAHNAVVIWVPKNTNYLKGIIQLEKKYSEGNGQRRILYTTIIKKLMYYITILISMIFILNNTKTVIIQNIIILLFLMLSYFIYRIRKILNNIDHHRKKGMINIKRLIVLLIVVDITHLYGYLIGRFITNKR